MGLRGPAKKPADQKARQPRRAKPPVVPQEKDDATTFDGIALTAAHRPKWLQKQGAEIWDRLLPLAPQLRACDVATFADYCQTVAQMEQLQTYVAKHGYFRKTSNGCKQKFEEVSLLNELRAQALKLADVLGMTPKGRKAQGIELKIPTVVAVDDGKKSAAGIVGSRRTADQVGYTVPAALRS